MAISKSIDVMSANTPEPLPLPPELSINLAAKPDICGAAIEVPANAWVGVVVANKARIDIVVARRLYYQHASVHEASITALGFDPTRRGQRLDSSAQCRARSVLV